MKCQSYHPLYYTRNDLNADSNLSTRPVYTGHVAPPTGHFSQMFLNSHVSDIHRLSYDKELLRQTILQQEVTFKDQVQELHRLYRRQRELLDEIKRNNFYKNNALSEAQWPLNSLTSNVSFSSDQKAARGIAFDTLAFSQPSSLVSENVRSSSILDLSLSCTNIARRKPLDLQLPADEYINNEGKESSKNFEISGLSIWSTHTSNRACPLVSSSPKHMCSGTLSDFPDKKKLKMCKDFIEAEDGKSRSSLKNSSDWYSYSESLQRLAEPGQAHQTAPLFTKKDDRLEIGRRNSDAKIMGSIHGMLNLYTPGQVGGASHRPVLEFPAAHSGKVNFPAIKSREPCVDELDNSFRPNANVKASSASSSFLFQNYKCDLGTAENETAKHTNRLGSFDLNCTAVGVLDGFSADDLTSPELVSSQVSTSSVVVVKEKHVGVGEFPDMPVILGSTNVDQEQTGHSGKSLLFDMNLPCHLIADTVSLEDDPLIDDQNHLDLINLDSNLKDDQISPSSASSMQVAEVDLEAPMIPVSPEKRESRRPRGESEENKTELRFPLCTREDGESVDDLMKIAVDVLVSISSSEAQQNSEQFSDELLIWFAEIVCSKEHGDELTASNSTEIDYFEAMTLKLTETSEEDYWPKTTTLLNEKETSDSPFSGESSKGGRTTKRVKRKNFQREVLPSLATLSRYEVTEDIQIIEMLMETNGTPLQMGVKARKVGKKRRIGGRKKMHITDTAWESRICLLALPQMGNKAADLKEKGGVKWWENTPRQPRGKRRRNGFPNSTLSLSQEGWMRKWGGIGFVQKGKKKLKQVEMLVPQGGSS